MLTFENLKQTVLNIGKDVGALSPNIALTFPFDKETNKKEFNFFNIYSGDFIPEIYPYIPSGQFITNSVKIDRLKKQDSLIFEWKLYEYEYATPMLTSTESSYPSTIKIEVKSGADTISEEFTISSSIECTFYVSAEKLAPLFTSSNTIKDVEIKATANAGNKDIMLSDLICYKENSTFSSFVAKNLKSLYYNISIINKKIENRLLTDEHFNLINSVKTQFSPSVADFVVLQQTTPIIINGRSACNFINEAYEANIKIEVNKNNMVLFTLTNAFGGELSVEHTYSYSSKRSYTFGVYKEATGTIDTLYIRDGKTTIKPGVTKLALNVYGAFINETVEIKIGDFKLRLVFSTTTGASVNNKLIGTDDVITHNTITIDNAISLLENRKNEVATLEQTVQEHDDNIKLILEDTDRVKITDFYHLRFDNQESYIQEGFSSVRTYGDKTYRIYLKDDLNAGILHNCLAFKLNHNNGGVITFINRDIGSPVDVYGFTKTGLQKLDIFKEDEDLFYIPDGKDTFLIRFRLEHNVNYKIYKFIVNGLNFEVFLSKYDFPLQATKTNPYLPERGNIASTDNNNLIRNSVGTTLENFSQFKYKVLDFGRKEFYIDKTYQTVMLDDYFYWDKSLTSYNIKAILSQKHDKSLAYAFMLPYDADGKQIYSHSYSEEPVFDIVYNETTNNKIVIDASSGPTGDFITRAKKLTSSSVFAFAFMGRRFIQRDDSFALSSSFQCADNVSIPSNYTQAIIVDNLRLNNTVSMVIDEDNETVTFNLLKTTLSDGMLELLKYEGNITMTFYAEQYCYFAPQIRNSNIPENSTTYNLTINTTYPYPNNNPNYIYNKIFKNAASYFKIGFLCNRFQNLGGQSLVSYLEENGEPRFTIHSIKMTTT